MSFLSPIRLTAPLAAPIFCLLVGLAVDVRRVCAEVDPAVLSDEAARVRLVERISAPTIAILEPSGTNGGSGVIISRDGYALTNFHVVAPCGPQMIVGTSDGRTHDGVLVGLDPTGDVALVKILGEGPYTAAELGESGRVRVGDTAIVAGNPFLLAEDFSPSVSVGIISGVRRYQPPSNSILEYADCLQTDAAINPGNSGGPLYDGAGRLIGVVGRASFEKRGRVSVGLGYAVSIDQIKRFLPHLRGGLIADHGSLGATVRTTRRAGVSLAVVDAVDTSSEAYRRGLRPGDELVSIGGREIATANELLNVVGATPPGWRLRVVWRRGSQLHDKVIRLEPLHRSGELREAIAGEFRHGDEDSERAPLRYYEREEGFANYYFTRLQTDRVLNAWTGSSARPDSRGRLVARLLEERIGEQSEIVIDRQAIEWATRKGRFRIDTRAALDEQPSPPAAPGLLAGLWVWWTLATEGADVLDSLHYSGGAPWTAESEVCDVLAARHHGVLVNFYLDTSTGSLIGFDAVLDAREEPTRVEFLGDPAGGLPTAWRVLVGEGVYAELGVLEATVESSGRTGAP